MIRPTPPSAAIPREDETMTAPDTETLLPCPFCRGAGRKMVKGRGVRCDRCKAWGPDEMVPFASWNTRAPAPDAALIAELAFFKSREKHYAKLLNVTDAGQYRNDWDAAITALIAERDALIEALQRIEEASNHYATVQTFSEDTLRYAHESTKRLALAALAAITGDRT